MTIYVVNDDIGPDVLNDLQSQAPNGVGILAWPADNRMPADLDAGILIVLPTSKNVERERVAAIVKAGKRLICVYLADATEVSDLAQDYCTVKITLGGGGFAGAISGENSLQQTPSGDVAPRNRHKTYECK